MNRVIFGSLILFGGCTIVLKTGTRTLHSPQSGSEITSAAHVPHSLASSRTVTSLINPNGNTAWCDSRSVLLKLSSTRKLSDEQVLARFMKGFFGGWFFTPERYLLRLPIWREPFVSFPVHTSSEKKGIWQVSQISSEKLPELDSLYFGAFQVVEEYMESTKGGESYVDVAYGKYESSFAGVHRFSLQRQEERVPASQKTLRKDDGEEIRITMSCVTCNAKEDRRIAPAWISMLHRAYAMVLFREGIAEVLR